MRQLTQYRPSTFEERGTAIPFTTPLLVQTRVRLEERDRLVLTMPSLGGGSGVYVVPWKAVPDLVTMSVHDHALHAEILEAQAVSPDLIRTAALNVALTGIAGPEAEEAAQLALHAEESERVTTNFMLILALFTHLGLSPKELLNSGGDPARFRQVAKSVLAQAADRFGATADELYARIGKLASQAAPVGLANAPGEGGRLRKVSRDLTAFCAATRSWARSDRSDAAPMAQFAAEVAEETLKLTREVLDNFDLLLGDIEAALTSWKTVFEQVRKAAIRLSWLLDGWDFIVTLWAQTPAAPSQAKRDAITQIMRILPLIPVNEGSWEAMNQNERHEVFQRRRVAAMQDWRTGQFDAELVARIEAVRAINFTGGG
ncbi:hypothetical protein [Zavarzinia sp. CC-PAN008]|uniref:hypothetical protein n=1 Tax=Zavarzinia sp. CC-PAN008 TaxID=3243332 RepID=UPI003F74828C